MTFSTIRASLSAQVATGGTFDVTYPTSKDRGSFSLGTRHTLSALGKIFTCPESITISFGSTAATITYNGASTIPAGSPVTVQLDEIGNSTPIVHGPSAQAIAHPATTALLNLGSPGAPAATAVAAAQAIAGAANAVLNGTLASGGVAVLNAITGRNVLAVSANAGDTTQTLTVTGTDMYGVAMRETIALNGTTIVPGKKAFKRVTSVAVSAAMAGNLTVGTGDVLGIPAYLPNTSMVLKESLDGASATSGTLVAGLAITTKPTASNADVRGTYDPNSACDGSRAFNLLVALPDPTFLGSAQFAA